MADKTVIRLLSTSSCANESTHIQISTTDFDGIYLLPPPIDWCFNNLEASDSTALLKSSLLSGKALAVSDGSFYPIQQVGACAWIIASSDGTEWISGGGLIPGPEQSSYRSELVVFSAWHPLFTVFFFLQIHPLFISLPCVMVCWLSIKVSLLITRLNLK